MRSLIAFPCDGDTLIGTLDSADGKTGLLIVSGGNEIRVGAHRGMAALAQRVAAAGYPVFRFDRRGIGDSAGINRGFDASADDIAVAASTFRREARVRRVIALGLGDGATALALNHPQARIDALLLANPWPGDPDSNSDPPAARKIIRFPLFNKRLSNEDDSDLETSPLDTRLARSLNDATIPITILLAARDSMAMAFAGLLRRADFAAVGTRISRRQHDTASHGFSNPADQQWLFDRVIEALGA
ncbi:serine aminopeptidase domain-containing protein [Sphingomonas sp. RS6]